MPGSDSPAFSVVIPTRERPAQLAACLDALGAAVRPPGGFEVIVVDDGGRIDLAPVVEPHRGRLDLSLLHRANAGPGAARNEGAESARGRMLAFTDDDMLVEPGWLRALAEQAGSKPGAAVGGRTVNARPENRYSRASQQIADRAYAHHNEGPGGASFFAANNLAVPAGVFRELGGFDPSLRISEDRDFCARWRESGRPMVYAEGAVARHARELDLGSFWRQHFGYGRGAFAYHWARRRRGLPFRDGFRASFHLEAAGKAAARARSDPRGALLIVLWQLANTAGFLREALTQLPPRRAQGARVERAPEPEGLSRPATRPGPSR